MKLTTRIKNAFGFIRLINNKNNSASRIQNTFQMKNLLKENQDRINRLETLVSLRKKSSFERIVFGVLSSTITIVGIIYFNQAVDPVYLHWLSSTSYLILILIKAFVPALLVFVLMTFLYLVLNKD